MAIRNQTARPDGNRQTQFEEVKRKAGITADIAFYTDEMNFKKREITEDEAARDFLTALWDALSVVAHSNPNGVGVLTELEPPLIPAVSSRVGDQISKHLTAATTWCWH